VEKQTSLSANKEIHCYI